MTWQGYNEWANSSQSSQPNPNSDDDGSLVAEVVALAILTCYGATLKCVMHVYFSLRACTIMQFHATEKKEEKGAVGNKAFPCW